RSGPPLAHVRVDLGRARLAAASADRTRPARPHRLARRLAGLDGARWPAAAGAPSGSWPAGAVGRTVGGDELPPRRRLAGATCVICSSATPPQTPRHTPGTLTTTRPPGAATAYSSSPHS